MKKEIKNKDERKEHKFTVGARCCTRSGRHSPTFPWWPCAEQLVQSVLRMWVGQFPDGHTRWRSTEEILLWWPVASDSMPQVHGKNCAKPNKNINRDKRVSGRRPSSSIQKERRSVSILRLKGEEIPALLALLITGPVIIWSAGPATAAPQSGLGTDTDPVSKTSYPFRIHDDGRRPKTSVMCVQCTTVGRLGIQNGQSTVWWPNKSVTDI
jgi:hypothetical protein